MGPKPNMRSFSPFEKGPGKSLTFNASSNSRKSNGSMDLPNVNKVRKLIHPSLKIPLKFEPGPLKNAGNICIIDKTASLAGHFNHSSYLYFGFSIRISYIKSIPVKEITEEESIELIGLRCTLEKWRENNNVSIGE